MAVEFNLLSGATIDNQLRLLYELLRGGDSYLGFSRSHETWGQGTLCRYAPVSGQTWPNDIIGETAHAEIYDDQHRLMNISNDGTTAVQVARFTYADGETEVPQANDDRLEYLTEASQNGVVHGMSNIECIFINQKWMTLRGIDPTYEFILYREVSDGFGGTVTKNCKYFVMNFDKDIENLLEIEIIKEFEYPGLSTRVQLKYGPIGSMDATSADIVPGCTDLERRINLNGEYLVTGIGATFINWMENDETAKNSTFFLVDMTGALLVDGVQYEETYISNTENAYIFSYMISNSEPDPAPPEMRKVRFKLTTLSNINNRFSIFKESLPVISNIAPVADNNPPGLPISYIRSQDIHESIFDVVGLHQLTQNDVWLAYEIPAPYDGSNPVWQHFEDMRIALADPNMLSMDSVDIDEDYITGLTISKMYALTKDLSLGASENFNLIMVNLELDSVTPTTDIYRQLFISWKPRYFDGLSNALVHCGTGNNTGPDYNGRSTFFDPNNHTNDLGTLFYVANKMPVYRGYIDGTEQFKIIL